MRTSFLIFSGIVLGAAGLQQYAAFDAASASSTYSAGNLAGSPAFAAQQALSGGSGYWWAACSLAAVAKGTDLFPSVLFLQVLKRQPHSGAERGPENRTAKRFGAAFAVPVRRAPALECQTAAENAKITLLSLCLRALPLEFPIPCPRCDLDRCPEFPPFGSGFEGGLGVRTWRS